MQNASEEHPGGNFIVAWIDIPLVTENPLSLSPVNCMLVRVTGEISSAALRSRLRIAMLLELNPVILAKKKDAMLIAPSSNLCTRRVPPPCLMITKAM